MRRVLAHLALSCLSQVLICDSLFQVKTLIFWHCFNRSDWTCRAWPRPSAWTSTPSTTWTGKSWYTSSRHKETPTNGFLERQNFRRISERNEQKTKKRFSEWHFFRRKMWKSEKERNLFHQIPSVPSSVVPMSCQNSRQIYSRLFLSFSLLLWPLCSFVRPNILFFKKRRFSQTNIEDKKKIITEAACLKKLCMVLFHSNHFLLKPSAPFRIDFNQWFLTIVFVSRNGWF